jgi:hypothetical protein
MLNEADAGVRLPPLFASLADELANVVDVLGHVAPTAPTLVVDDQRQLLEAIHSLDGGLAHGELIDSAYRLLCNALPEPKIRILRDAIDSFDFDAARVALANLRTWLAQQEEAA